MSDQTKRQRGEAAWKEQREAISRRNVEARRQGRAERENRDKQIAARLRTDAQREADQVRKLNMQIARAQGDSR
jgi:hypothetical protein